MTMIFCRCASARWGIMLAALLMPVPVSAAPLTLADAIARAENADPGVKSAGARVDAAEAGVRQAGRRPNPSLNVTAENFGGSGTLSGFQASETTLALSQPFELGGKRRARVALAQSERAASELRRQVRKADLALSVENAFFTALAAKREVTLASDRLSAMTKLKAEADRRVGAARDPLFAGARVSAFAIQAKVALAQAEAKAATARATLASFFPGNADFELDPGQLMRLDEVPVVADALSPDLALLEVQNREARARAELEEAKGIPDPVVQMGVRHFELNNDNALIAGVSLPLPLFDNNGGNIARARAERRAVEQDVLALRAARMREIAQVEARVKAGRDEAETLRSTVLPEVERALRLVREGFSRGGFSYLDVLETERAYAEARLRHAEVLKTFHLDNAIWKRLTGRYAEIASTEGAR